MMTSLLSQGRPCIKKCYVKERQIEIKNRPVFVLFSKVNGLLECENTLRKQNDRSFKQ
jgi:hypothetical protein